MPKKEKFINREISWLSFNGRVLQEAADRTVPIIERLRFLGIFSNNLDEFFRVRVATLKRLLLLGKKAKAGVGFKPKKILGEVQKIVLSQSREFEKIYADILRELRRQKIFIINETQLTKTQKEFVNNYFNDHVRPALVPIMINQVKTFPYLKDKTIYLAIKLSIVGKVREKQYSLIEIPSNTVDRFVILPSHNQNQYIILLDDIIRFNLPEVFSFFPFNKFEAYTIKLTRDAELDIENDISQSFFDKISKSVKARQKGDPVRFVYDSAMPKDLLDFIKLKMKLRDLTNLIPGGRYHNFKDFIKFPTIGSRTLVYEKLKPLTHKLLRNNQSFFDVLKRQDLMLHYPYQRFSQFIDLLREAAIDPNVKTIKITLYRLAKDSMVINALINAAQNGKHVIALLELQARFDEEANINWAKHLQEQGIQVIYGVPGLKVHSKFCLISRLEAGKIQLYANVTTGNYNEITSQVYCDDSLLTSDSRITKEVEHVFEFFEKNYKIHHFKHLILSPQSTRKKLVRLIENEIEFVKSGKKGEIFIKLNSLIDEELMSLLYDAGKAGVKIRIIVRGVCGLKPGLPVLNNNIEIISIVDRLLEHSRVLFFRNGGEQLCFLSSADWMARNLDSRIEVTCPVYDKAIQKELRTMLDIQWSDNVKARVMNDEQSNKHKSVIVKKKVNAQNEIYRYLSSKA